MNPTAGSFTVNERLQRHFWTCSVQFPEQHALNVAWAKDYLHLNHLMQAPFCACMHDNTHPKLGTLFELKLIEQEN